jgi:5-methylcytosine-specific restriction endonuclease McrA
METNSLPRNQSRFANTSASRTRARGNPTGTCAREIRELYGNLCYRCGSTKDITIDHIVPKSADGCGVPTNLQPLCQACNEEKADQLPEKLILALDFLMRPAPWDSYEALIW